MERIVWVLAALALLPAEVFGQNELLLRRFFEGKECIVKIDMPAHKSGVDLRPEEPFPLDYRKLGERTRRYGVSLEEGARALITEVKVKKKNIEFHLNGGGYAQSYSAPLLISTSVSKSNYEKRLEREIEEEFSLSRRRELEEELEDVQEARKREEDRLKLEVELNARLAEVVEFELRRQAGSRFNLWYEKGVPETITPEEVAAVLRPYLELRVVDRTGNGLSAGMLPLRKGMSEADVRELLGEPDRRTERQASEGALVELSYLFEEVEYRIQFAGELLVGFTLNSR